MATAAQTAPPSLTLVGGAYLLEICDADGRAFAYALDPLDGLGRWDVRLTRMDTGATYRVSLGLDGRWRCTCKDMEFGNRHHRSRPRGAPCKHRAALEPLWALAKRLSPKTEESCPNSPTTSPASAPA